MGGKCKLCEIETEDVWYVFCSIECQRIHWLLREKEMGKYDIDKELYVIWLTERMETIATMTREQVEERITEIGKIEFFAKREWAMLHQHWDKLTGRKGIAPWLKEERDKLITDPTITVNWEGEPRKKEKKPKQDLVKDLLGHDIKDLTAALKGKKNGKPEKVDLNAALEEMMAADSTPTKKEVSQENLDRAEEMKRKMRERLANKDSK